MPQDLRQVGEGHEFFIDTSGCLYFGADGAMDTCIALRTAVVKDGTMYVQAGGGIAGGVLGIAFAGVRRDFLQAAASHIERTDTHRRADPLVQVERSPVDTEFVDSVVEKPPGLGSVADDVDTGPACLGRDLGDALFGFFFLGFNFGLFTLVLLPN